MNLIRIALSLVNAINAWRVVKLANIILAVMNLTVLVNAVISMLVIMSF